VSPHFGSVSRMRGPFKEREWWEYDENHPHPRCQDFRSNGSHSADPEGVKGKKTRKTGGVPACADFGWRKKTCKQKGNVGAWSGEGYVVKRSGVWA